MKDSFLITGMYRSGTTLMDKVLHAHPALVVGSQPFPLLFYTLKQRFLDEKQIERRYPIEPLFMEESYQLEEFHQFLERFSFSAESLRTLFQTLAGYDGIQTMGFPEYCLEKKELDSLSGKPFIEIYHQLLTWLAQFLGEPECESVGAKEIICEEYIPWLLRRGTRVIHIIRDPRDSIASLSTGEGRQFMGAVRPTLYTVRMWRKSVAFAIEHVRQENYFMLRYEDFVENPFEILNRIADFFSIDAFDSSFFKNGIRDQNGQLWKGNSSFDQYQFISAESVGKYRTQLPAEQIKFIETLCYPELRWMGYDISQDAISGLDTIDKIKLNEVVEDDRFPKTYSVDPENLRAEKNRLEKLSQTLSRDEAVYWFIFERAYETLSRLA